MYAVQTTRYAGPGIHYSLKLVPRIPRGAIRSRRPSKNGQREATKTPCVIGNPKQQQWYPSLKKLRLFRLKSDRTPSILLDLLPWLRLLSPSHLKRRHVLDGKRAEVVNKSRVALDIFPLPLRIEVPRT